MNSPAKHAGVLELHTLGGLSLSRSGASDLSSILAQPKRAALLCYLVMARGFVRRDQLLPLFWPESDDAHARGSLRQAIHFLRRTLGEPAVASRGDEEVGIAAELVWCDAVAFEVAIAAGREEDALALYRGDFLPGFVVEGTPDFDLWLERERDRLRRRAVTSAWALAERLEGTGDSARAAELGRNALALAPTDDALLRRFMLLLERTGDVSGALREYQRYERFLRIEYDLDPPPEAQRLASEIAARRKAASDSCAWQPLEIAPAPVLAPLSARPPEGRRRSRYQWLFLGVVLVLAAMFARVPLSQGAESARRVVVVPFENATGDDSLAPLGTLMADAVTRGVALSGLAEAVPPPDGEPRSPLGLARAVNAGLVVSGRYFLAGDTIEVDAHAILLRGPGREIGLGRIRGLRTELDSLNARAADRILGAVALEFDHPLGGQALGTEVVRAPSYEAYRAYREAAAHFVDVDFEQATTAYRRAIQLDPTFYRAVVDLGWSQLNNGNGLAAESTFVSIAPHLAELDPNSLADFEGGMASIDGSWARAYRRIRDIPGCQVSCNNDLATLALAQRRVHEAWRLLKRGPAAEHLVGLERWSGLYILRTNVLFALGRHEEELREARRAVELFPDLPRMVQLEGRALAALGRSSEAGALVETLLRTHRRPALPVDIIDVVALRDSAAARELYQRALALFSEWKNSAYAADLASARCLLALGRYEAALGLLQDLDVPRPSEPLRLLYLGTAAAGLGDRAAATSAERELASLAGTPVERARNIMRNAMIAAALGERERAVQLMKHAYAAGFPFGPALLYAPQFAGLRDYPPFGELVRPVD